MQSPFHRCSSQSHSFPAKTILITGKGTTNLQKITILCAIQPSQSFFERKLSVFPISFQCVFFSSLFFAAFHLWRKKKMEKATRSGEWGKRKLCTCSPYMRIKMRFLRKRHSLCRLKWESARASESSRVEWSEWSVFGCISISIKPVNKAQTPTQTCFINIKSLLKFYSRTT